MSNTRADGKPLRTSGWMEWTPRDIEVQNYCDMRREFQSHAMNWTHERFQLQKQISQQQDEIESLKEKLKEQSRNKFVPVA